MVGLDDATAATLKPLFEQFKINAEVVVERAAERLRREKFDGCAVRLGEGADDVLRAARTNIANSRMVIYGLCRDFSEARPYSKYGINVMLTLPIERREALKAIKGTHLLVLHEFRRYVRIPLAEEVVIEVSGSHMKATSHEISGGGMSLNVPVKLKTGDPMQVILTLAGGSKVSIPATVRWVRDHEELIGVRFEDEESRRKVKNWIDSYLGFE